jgi:hypothetical protein
MGPRRGGLRAEKGGLRADSQASARRAFQARPTATGTPLSPLTSICPMSCLVIVLAIVSTIAAFWSDASSTATTRTVSCGGHGAQAAAAPATAGRRASAGAREMATTAAQRVPAAPGAAGRQ